MIAGRMDYMRRTLSAMDVSDSSASRYYTVMETAASVAVTPAEEVGGICRHPNLRLSLAFSFVSIQDWRSEFVRLFSPYFDTLLAPRRRRNGTASRFIEIYQV